MDIQRDPFNDSDPSILLRTMLHDHDGELDMAEDRNHDDARASTEGEMDARVNQAADSMLSMQV